MNCYVCFGLSNFFCYNCNVLICENHLKTHSEIDRTHSIKRLEEKEFQTELSNRINKIDSAISNILKETNYAVLKINEFAIETTKRLENLKEKYLAFIKHFDSNNSDNIQTHFILKEAFKINDFNLKIDQILKTKYNELLVFSEKPMNDWNLLVKCQYLKESTGWRPDYSNEVMFSNEKKYAFNCNI